MRGKVWNQIGYQFWDEKTTAIKSGDDETEVLE